MRAGEAAVTHLGEHVGLGVGVVAGVLTPGGTYFAQHVGSGANVEISEYFLGPLELGKGRRHDVEAHWPNRALPRGEDPDLIAAFFGEFDGTAG